MATSPPAAPVQAPSAPSGTVPRTPLEDKPGAFRIAALHDPMRKRWMKALIYGPPGAGKTTLFGTAVDVPELRDVLFLMVDKGESVLEDNPRIKSSGLIDIVHISRIEQLQKIYEMLQHHCRFRDMGNDTELEKLQRLTFGIPEGEPIDRLRKWTTVILDSLTEIEAQNLAKTLNLDAQGLDAGADLEVAGFGEFRKNNHAIQRIVRAFRDLNVHLFVICAQQYNQDELKRYHYKPALTGKLSDQIQGMFDIVGWLVVGLPDASDETGKGPRRLFVQPQSGPRADAKNRFASYPKAFFDDPTMRSIFVGCGFLTPTKPQGS